MENLSPEKSIIALGPWLETPAGNYVRAWEQARLDALTADIFGFHAVQIGLPQIHALQANRMPYKWLSDMHLPQHQSAPQTNIQTDIQNNIQDKAVASVAVVHDFTELPFASQSVDLVVLLHVLEFTAEPHQVLREVERVLIPEGKVIVCGFNPASLWGMRQAIGRLTGAHFLPQDGEFISLLRLKDWLKLLNMEVNRGHFGCYAPPCTNEQWLHRFSFMEQAGDRWWPYFGAVYMVQAIKRIKGMRLIGATWEKKRGLLPNGIPATHKIHKNIHKT